MKTERRKHARRRLRDGSFIVTDQCSGKIARVVDISLGGMQMRYTPEHFICHQWSLVDLFGSDRNQIMIPNLDCRPVYDIASLMEDGSFSGMDVRLCGVAFHQLTDNQRTRLCHLLDRSGGPESTGAQADFEI